MKPRRGRFEFHTNADFILDRIEAGDGVLILRSSALLDVRFWEVAAAVVIAQRGLVEKDRLLAVDQSADLALTNQIENAEKRDRAKVVP